MSKFLFDVQQKNRLKQKGLLKRFSITCYGHQETVEEIRSIKSDKYKELKVNKNKKDFEEWFLNYKPDVLRENKELKKIQTKIKKQKSKKADKILTKNKITKNKNKNKSKYFFDIFGKKLNKTKKLKVKKY
jgi:hypothetical protein